MSRGQPSGKVFATHGKDKFDNKIRFREFGSTYQDRFDLSRASLNFELKRSIVKYKKTLVEIIEDISKTEGHKTPLTPEMIELTVDLALKVRPWTRKDMQSVYDICREHANSEM